ncbi:hypothetical protein OSC27_12490 [Microbacterium sp. STN6]|uniref:hypothetical protein n=1 Tax=Microbacterium sp. STN6 TaxID=2995588 RepID=UPI002260AE45|nr:hypothetical protein [Microbacterium sp. STN6]MCX7523089.1 hypothetical protein [Microbacterium sp. STN6]
MVLTASPTPTAPVSTWRRMLVVGVILIAIMAGLVLAFTLPNVHSSAHDIPISIAATQAQRTELEAALDKAGPKDWDFHTASSEGEAITQIRDRTVYGAFVVTTTGTRLDYATAASPAVANILKQTAQHLGVGAHTAVTTTDVQPFTHRDPKGVGLAAGALPIALGGWIAAVGIMAMILGVWRRILTIGGFTIFGGFGLVGTLFAVGTFNEHYLQLSLSAMLGIAATALLVLGLERALKGIGIGIAGVLLIALGNPLSGVTSAPELLPQPWGQIGQLLPPGATGTLLRDVAFFNGHGIAEPVVVLVGWLLIGIGLFAIGSLRHRSAALRGSIEFDTNKEVSDEYPELAEASPRSRRPQPH